MSIKKRIYYVLYWMLYFIPGFIGVFFYHSEDGTSFIYQQIIIGVVNVLEFIYLYPRVNLVHINTYNFKTNNRPIITITLKKINYSPYCKLHFVKIENSPIGIDIEDKHEYEISFYKLIKLTNKIRIGKITNDELLYLASIFKPDEFEYLNNLTTETNYIKRKLRLSKLKELI